jgi:hypothetical protein
LGTDGGKQRLGHVRIFWYQSKRKFQETKATWAERARHNNMLEAQLEADREEEKTVGISQLASVNRTAYFTGDIECKQKYFGLKKYELEGSALQDLQELDTSNVDLQYYSKDPSEFHQVVKLLSHWAKYREYSRVFFSTETKYISATKPFVHAAKVNVKGYYYTTVAGRGEKYFVDFVPKKRTKVHNPPKIGVERLNNYNYTYNGTGIIKLLSFNGKVVARVLKGYTADSTRGRRT